MTRYGGPSVKEVGEAAVIAAIRAAAPSQLNGDDAAVLGHTAPNSKTVACTDVLVRGRHFHSDYSTAREVGIKAVTQNFADIQAMGARATAMLLGLTLPEDCPLSWVCELAEGIDAALHPWAAQLVGGDVVKGPELVISVTALGELTGPAPALQITAAKSDQQLIAHGKIGYSAAGLALLEKVGSRANIPADDPVLQELVNWHCAPTLVAGQGTVARATGVSAMTDNSDGLIPDLNLLARSSGVSIDVDPQAIAPDAALQHAAQFLGTDPWEWVLSGGEDHSLIGTTSRRIPTGFRRIGETRAAGAAGPSVTLGGKPPAYTQGWASL